LPNLEWIDLCGCNITHIPDSVLKLSKLDNLEVKGKMYDEDDDKSIANFINKFNVANGTAKKTTTTAPVGRGGSPITTAPVKTASTGGKPAGGSGDAELDALMAAFDKPSAHSDYWMTQLLKPGLTVNNLTITKKNSPGKWLNAYCSLDIAAYGYFTVTDFIVTNKADGYFCVGLAKNITQMEGDIRTTNGYFLSCSDGKLYSVAGDNAKAYSNVGAIPTGTKITITYLTLNGEINFKINNVDKGVAFTVKHTGTTASSKMLYPCVSIWSDNCSITAEKREKMDPELMAIMADLEAL